MNLGPEAAARLEIDAMLTASGWVVQDFKQIALGVARAPDQQLKPCRQLVTCAVMSTVNKNK